MSSACHMSNSYRHIVIENKRNRPSNGYSVKVYDVQQNQPAMKKNTKFQVKAKDLFQLHASETDRSLGDCALTCNYVDASTLHITDDSL